MGTLTSESVAVRDALEAHRDDLREILQRYGAAHPRVFGSVARGDATAESDRDLLVDLLPLGGNPRLRVSGIGKDLSMIVQRRVDVVTSDVLRDDVSATAMADAVPV